MSFIVIIKPGIEPGERADEGFSTQANVERMVRALQRMAPEMEMGWTWDPDVPVIEDERKAIEMAEELADIMEDQDG